MLLETTQNITRFNQRLDGRDRHHLTEANFQRREPVIVRGVLGCQLDNNETLYFRTKDITLTKIIICTK